jgi:hypothetical protein
MSELHFNITIASCVVLLISLIHSYRIIQISKAKEAQNNHKLSELEKTSASEILQQINIEKESILIKLESGEVTFKKLEIELEKSKKALKPIDVGLLPPIFSFHDSEELKDKIKVTQDEQLKCIQSGKAITMLSGWTWDDSKSKGDEMLAGYNYLTLKAFNAEFDVMRKQMRLASFDIASNKLSRLREQLAKLGETARVTVSKDYYFLKVAELEVWHAELLRKEDHKQARKVQQSILRQQSSREIEDSEDIEDDLYYKQSDLNKAQILAKSLHGKAHAKLKLEVQKLKEEIAALEIKQARSISQAQITKAGYIYVISNIGCFGEGIVKIGMTRRLEPMDRVNELGDASVAFKFDVHAMAFVDNAPLVERTLHNKFNSYRVNKHNNRKEFFKVAPKDVENAMSQMGIKTDWYFEIEAREYRASQQIREASDIQKNNQLAVSEQLPSSI